MLKINRIILSLNLELIGRRWVALSAAPKSCEPYKYIKLDARGHVGYGAQKWKVSKINVKGMLNPTQKT